MARNHWNKKSADTMKKKERRADSHGSVINCHGTQVTSGDQNRKIICFADFLNDAMHSDLLLIN